MRLEEVTAFLARLTGESVGPDQAVRLRSIQRAAFTTWANQQTPPIALPGLSSEATSVRQMLGASTGAQPAGLPPGTAPMLAVSNAQLGVGIDIEQVDSLPQVYDYREHPFYQDNFTPAEIARCLRQSDVRSAFCGLWAAKEAVFKAGLGGASGSLRRIEITHDVAGRPCFPGCQLSISHTAAMAVAICIVAAAPTPATARAELAGVLAEPATKARPPRPALRAAAVALAASTVALGAVALALIS